MAATTLKGRLISGLGYANATIPKQMPYFKGKVPGIEEMHSGTLNIELEQPFNYSGMCFHVGPVQWTAGLCECFEFIKTTFSIGHEKAFYDAYIYRPSGSKNRQNHCLVEVITQKIDGIADLMSRKTDVYLTIY